MKRTLLTGMTILILLLAMIAPAVADDPGWNYKFDRSGGVNTYNPDTGRAFDKTILTAEAPVPSPGATGQARRARSLFFDLFSFDPARKTAGLAGQRKTNNYKPNPIHIVYSKACSYV